MERREFVVTISGVLGGSAVGRLGGPWRAEPPRRRATEPQDPTLGPEVFARRLTRLRAEMATQEIDLFVTEPGTNFRYLTSYDPGRSERLILLMVPRQGEPVIVCPAFEVERVKRNTGFADVRGWEEHEDPWRLARRAGEAWKPRRTAHAAVEHSTRYGMLLRLEAALPGWRIGSAEELLLPIRMIKAPEELALIRRAIGITEASIAATCAALDTGMTERDVARRLSQEMQSRGGSGGGLVQFGASSALPHGGPGGTALARETVVLIDGGASVEGYASDITRTIWWGDQPSDEFRLVFNAVHDAQTAAMGLARPFTVECQALDRAARGVITAAGFGQFFTHRLGHGMGMEGHEHPYLVEGNERRLEPGMVFTIEPGIYQLGKFGVRIEDDCVVTESGLEVMSSRPSRA
jgi:Xaa-Pro dipeptidase